MEPEIKIPYHVYTRILSGFYMSVVDFQIVKGPGTNRIKISKVPDKTNVETGYTDRKWSRYFTVFGA